MSNKRWIADSYGKINLGLHVLEKLPTGYHRIETGFAFIEWSDRFEVRISDEYELTITGSDIPTDGTNLISRAYNAFNTYVGLKRNYHFTVSKQIPAGAGLGGGSSNAALTFRMLNKMEDAGLSDDEIVDLCRDLGADIPFFVYGKTGIGSGIGQDIDFADIQPDAWIVTVFPGFESSTAEAYRHCAPNPDPGFSLKGVLLEEPLEEWQYLLQNDLEQAVIPQHEMVGNIKDQLLDFGADYAAMSGSGSTVFGIFDQDFVAINAYESFHELGLASKLTRPKFQPDYGIYVKE
ncbi:4-(cytidine 5'-diphospho)-2-C-methyl-D-erythritol kinase [Rhodohalobacter sp. SW132]|uniref:4-(cytidine 5'-diphospho)-2-C-methyl-D-erythritol kinase n=1 Tax=Rhodohalobacter sp. SW132 TaxID=2293433 RepID=UPI000E23CE6D|nr:4-(cytidine 5'-diphospho)-2-C-methyl-D-erythritol kinase [Rhodohalobacter sp. SW132]REL38781.1 4-(cytidine 5'-diphospho)-2-C-methyl-D-erythritol kinase [Rhodohalobacter sp. SW132]